jgi:hypothetical protein
MKRFLIAISFLLAAATPAVAYKQVVHRAITRRAWVRALPSFDLKTHLGIDALTTLDGRVPRDWTEQGADDEDNGTNSLNHFFDPRHNAALTVQPLCIGLGLIPNSTAPDWALELLGTNSYTVGQAQNDYLFSVIGLDDAERKSQARDLFKSLGHVVHLVQDMGQPEHTRNDQHLFPLFGLAPASIYEEWGLQHLVGLNPDISFEGYPTMHFPRYRDYFHTDNSTLGFPTGHGLADFSNNNFVTQDTNYNDEKDPGKCYHYDLPVLPADDAARVETVDEIVWIGGFQVKKPVKETIFTSSIVDYVSNLQDSDPFHTFFSSLDLETHLEGTDVYSLGDGSYVTRASMLIPRAVGYSAGLMERFFRGKIDVKWTATATATYDMTITNLSQDAIASDARLFSYYRNADPGSASDLHFISGGKLADLVSGFNGLSPGQSVTITGIQPAQLPVGKKLEDFEKRIAIQGTLGTEVRAVIGLVQPSDEKGYKLVLTWDNNSVVAAVPRVNEQSNPQLDCSPGFQCAVAYNFDPSHTFEYDTIPDSTITAPVNAFSGGPTILRIKSIVPGASYFVNVIGNSIGPDACLTTNATGKLYLDGDLVKQNTIAVDNCSFFKLLMTIP